MPDSPCTRCNGSGTEPDSLTVAFDVMVREVNNVASDIQSRGWAMGRYRDACAARITSLESALRDILGRISGDLPGNETWLRVPNEDVRNWRKVLGGDPETRPDEHPWLPADRGGWP